MGAWYELGGVSFTYLWKKTVTNAASDRHICYVVPDIAVAQRHLSDAGTEIISDPRPIAWRESVLCSRSRRQLDRNSSSVNAAVPSDVRWWLRPTVR